MPREIPASNPVKDVTPEYRYFEGINIQWNRVPWSFTHERLGAVSIDTYSIWNPAHHGEIADRLAEGQRCALYMMGNFGVGELFRPAGGDAQYEILDAIKQRERAQNLVVFAHPHDIGQFIDFERLPQEHRHLEDSSIRLAIYPGPMHAIMPIKPEEMPSLGLIKDEDQSAAFFWIPGHWGYEQLVLEMQKRVGNGLFGGGSLNIHGQEPSYTAAELRDREMVMHPEWLEGIDFVILDEIAQAGNIGRSHTQVTFMQDPPVVIRRGSMTPEKIARETGYRLDVDGQRKPASSKTPYDTIHNTDSDRKVEIVLARIGRYQARFQAWLDREGRSSGPQI